MKRFQQRGSPLGGCLRRFQAATPLACSCAVGTIVCLVAAVGPASAQECVDYRSYIHFVGRSDLPAQASDIVIDGSHAYITSSSGLHVIDVSTPDAPIIISSLGLPSAIAVAISDSHAYVTDDSTGLVVVDASFPARPRIVASVPTPGTPTGVAILGTKAYVADWFAGLHVIDVADSLSPRIVGTSVIPGVAVSVAAANNYAYVTSFDSLLVVDVSRPTTPSVVGRVGFQYPAIGVAVVGPHAYVASGGLTVVDVSDPTSPRIVGRVSTHNAKQVAVWGSYAYVFGAASSLQDGDLSVIDVSNPAFPSTVGSFGTHGFGNVAAVPPYAYIVDGRGFTVVDIANHGSPSAGPLLTTSGRQLVSVAVSSPLACAVDLDGLQVIDASVPALPALRGRIEATAFRFSDVDVAGYYAYVIDDVGLLVATLANPALPTVLGEVQIADQPRGVANAGSLTCIAGATGLHVIDVSKPDSPTRIGGIVTPGLGEDVVVVGHHAYLAGGLWQGPNSPAGTLSIIDISNPALPAPIGSVSTPGAAYFGVAVDGAYAYVAANENGLKVIDVSDPTRPVVVRSVQVPGLANDVAVVGNLAYVATGTAGLTVVDITDPRSAALVGGMDTVGIGASVAVAGSVVYVADGRGLQVLPTQCEQTPVLVSDLTACPVQDGFLVTWRLSQQAVVELAGVAVERAELETGTYANLTTAALEPQVAMRFLDSDVPAATSSWYRLKLLMKAGEFHVVGPVRVSRNQASFETNLDPPVVSEDHTTINLGFRIGGSSQHVQLDIFSVEGRLVRRLASGPRAPGKYVATWNRYDGSGNRVARGVYLVRLRADRVATRKVVLARR